MRGAQWALLRAARTIQGLDIIRLAERTGLSRFQISNIEQGKVESSPGWETVRVLARELGIPLDLIAFIEDHPEVDDQIANWVARQVLAGHDPDRVRQAILDRYGPA